MRAAIYSVCACVLVSFTHAAETVSWKDIGESVQIIGRLGVPLGTAVEIEATVVSGESLPAFRSDARFWKWRYLRVEAVDGVVCDQKPVMMFVVEPGPMDPIPIDDNDARRLEELRKQRNVNLMPVGTRLVLVVYESGAFDGRPPQGSKGDQFAFMSELPEPDIRANPSFRTRLHVREPEKPEAKDNQTAQPGATDNPDGAQRFREDH